MVQLLRGGTVSQSYSYNAYGYINADEYGVHEPFYGYNGEEHDPFTGLQYLRARYYAPQTGGFITQDSFAGILTNALSQNRYTYAENDPVNGIDPSGHAKAPGSATKGGGNKKGTSGFVGTPGQTNRTQNTSSRPKTTYTAPPYAPRPAPNYQKPTTYSSGAAKAAQNAKTLNGSSKFAVDTVSNIANTPGQKLTSASNQWSFAPPVGGRTLEDIKKMSRYLCDPAAPYLISSNKEYPYGAIIIEGITYPIYVPTRPDGPTYEAVWNVTGKYTNPFYTGFEINLFQAFVETQFEDVNGKPIYAGNVRLSDGRVSGSSNTIAAGTSSGLIGLLNVLNSDAFNRRFVSIVTEEYDGQRRAIILVGSKTENAKFNTYADGLPHSIYYSTYPNASIESYLESTFYDVYEQTTGSSYDGKHGEIYDIVITVDKLHQEQIYSSFLWVSEDGTLMETPRVHPNDSIMIGTYEDGKFKPFAPILEWMNPYPASEKYWDLLNSMLANSINEVK